MKIKTIKKILKLKIEDWTNSVNDNDVKKAIKDGAIVTGGSIASLLLREDVNDFDIYFKTKETLMTVCKYYCEGNDIQVWDGDRAKIEYDKIEQETKDFQEKNGGMGFDENKSRLATFLKDIEPNRVKLFVGHLGHKRIDPLDYKKNITDNTVLPYQPAFFSPNAISLTDKLQIVIRFWGPVEGIHKNYDFVHATNYYDVSENNLVLKDRAMESLLTKELYYVGSLYPLTSVIRAKKFIQRGWTITAGSYLKICFQVSKLDLEDIKVLEEQLIGVDIAYFSTLVDILKVKKENNPDFVPTYEWLAELIDKVFDGDEEDRETTPEKDENVASFGQGYVNGDGVDLDT